MRMSPLTHQEEAYLPNLIGTVHLNPLHADNMLNLHSP